MSLDPARYRFTLWKGSTFSKRIQILDEEREPKNLTDYTAKLVAKTTPGGTTLLTLDTDNGGITLGGINGTVDFFMSDEDTAAITWKSSYYVFSLIDSSGNLDYILHGPFRVRQV